eukprot:CAMPEP_0197669172 /NCGR_PEP_ID=MMETSP1338-20131121/71310_1 /TAXON_ID=43686 ORGANISM="Pelagodinium beii, Strain RCC1491" /NCGR_SAMPLE_ID=MMETSP1338 /ASSEMBLY_ACC=CAM_ASM_000754 /LENGTH=91 /DNA_ID=CAMNT_0043248679 /DNA_START=5 /DNA_END=278 /DNA_ORIENTATION=+
MTSVAHRDSSLAHDELPVLVEANHIAHEDVQSPVNQRDPAHAPGEWHFWRLQSLLQWDSKDIVRYECKTDEIPAETNVIVRVHGNPDATNE